jgi:pSer/pThr/pTyr-binding forkhead associated (FHA) protein
VGESGALETVAEGPTLVIRSGGGREGEHFRMTKDRMTVGRAPTADVFLDDITVSREHAVLERRDGATWVQDLSSLNGTYVNRERVEDARLSDGDEVQIGKYRLVFFSGHANG